MRCSGCLISAEAPEVSLKPGDHVTITYHEQQYDELVHSVCVLFIVYSLLSCLFVCKQVSIVTNHVSMATQWGPTLTLQDCIQMFSQKYVDQVIITMVTCYIM